MFSFCTVRAWNVRAWYLCWYSHISSECESSDREENIQKTYFLTTKSLGPKRYAKKAPARNPPMCAPLSTLGMENPYIRLMRTVRLIFARAIKWRKWGVEKMRWDEIRWDEMKWDEMRKDERRREGWRNDDTMWEETMR